MLIHASHQAVLALLRTLDSIPVKNFGDARKISKAYDDLVSAWGHDPTDLKDFTNENVTDVVDMEIESSTKDALLAVIPSAFDGGQVSGMGARLIMSIVEQLED